MLLAYFSPLGPQRSGISDYSEELLPHLADAGARVTLFVDGFRPSNAGLASRFDVRDYRRDPSALEDLGRFDAAVYHMGNDHRYHAGILDAMRARPGVVVFHDFALQDFFLGLARERGDLRVYLDEVAACHGEEARREAEELARKRRELAEAARVQGDAAERARIEADLESRVSAAEARIADVKDRALADIDAIARDAAGALVEALTGGRADEGEVARAVAAARAAGR